MHKLTKHFRLNKSTKRMLALISDPHRRGELCRIFAQAQYGASLAPSKREVTAPTKDAVTGLIVDE